MISTSGSGLGQLIISLAIATAARDNSLSFCFSDYIGGCTLLDLQKSNQLRSLLRSEKFINFLANVRESPFFLGHMIKSLDQAREVSCLGQKRIFKVACWEETVLESLLLFEFLLTTD